MSTEEVCIHASVRLQRSARLDLSFYGFLRGMVILIVTDFESAVSLS